MRGEGKIRDSQGFTKSISLNLRIGLGVATGRDEIFAIPKSKLPKSLEPYAYPTISGNELSAFKPGEAINYDKLNYVMLVPYSRDRALKALIGYLSKWRDELESQHIVWKEKRYAKRELKVRDKARNHMI